MFTRALKNLVEDGMLISFNYENKNDTNNRGDDLWYEELTLTFPNGEILIITSEKLIIQ